MKLRRVRSMREFAEQMVRIPNGPFKGRFNVRRQPFSVLWLELVDSGEYNRFVATGPTQSGKTLCAFVILYYAIEYGEDVAVGVSEECTAKDKWQTDNNPEAG